MKEAGYYDAAGDGVVHCWLCAHRCRISPGKRGICGVRENRGGVLYSLVYGKVVARNVDPIEKKPLFHFLPGSRSFSISTVGCNFHCRHCQNFHISQYPHSHGGAITGTDVTAEEIVDEAAAAGCESISYTYVEPTIFLEFAKDCAKLAHQRGIRNVFVSNGYMTAEAAEDIAPYLDAINIDIKSFTDSFYKKICQAKLEPVLESVRKMHDLGVWVEITTLLIPGLNDSEESLRSIAGFIKEVDPDMPWHVTGFYPAYRLTDVPPTPVETLQAARQIGQETGLSYVYEGNRPGTGGENTACPGCGAELVSRWGFSVRSMKVGKGHCPACNASIAGVW